MIRSLGTISVVCILALARLGCSDGNPGSPVQSGYTITGSLVFKKDITLPQGAEVVGLWLVSSGSPDYMYVYGRGTIDAAKKTFNITFDQAPPRPALNCYPLLQDSVYLGVGAICIVQKSGFQGKLSGDVEHMETGPTGKLLGVVNNMGLIFESGDYSGVDSTAWPRLFPAGYCMGRGVSPKPGKIFDTFEPISPAGLQMVVSDDIQDFEFTNWTLIRKLEM